VTEHLVCPKCAVAKIGVGELLGGVVRVACAGCGWVGKYSDLLTIGGPDLSATEIAEEVSIAYLRLLAQYVGRPMGLAMAQAGIVGAQDPQQLGRLIKAACHGAHKATLDEVEKIQREYRDGKRPDA